MFCPYLTPGPKIKVYILIAHLQDMPNQILDYNLAMT